MFLFLTVVQAIVAAALVGVVLMQRSEGGGLGIGGNPSGALGARGAADFLTKPYTFNAICPAYVDTPIITRNTTSISQRAGVSEEQARQMMVGANRHKRLIAPEEIAAAAMWLVGPGSDSVNGAISALNVEPSWVVI